MFDPLSGEFSLRPGADDFGEPWRSRECFGHEFANTVFEGELDSEFSSQAHFSHCTFNDVTWVAPGLAGLTFEACRFAGSDWTRKDLRGLHFRHCKFEKSYPSRFAGAKIRDCEFSGSLIEQVDFSKADLSGTRFDNCLIVRPEFTGTLFSRQITRNVSSSDFKLTGCHCVQLDLSKRNLSGVDLYASRFDDCTFVRCDLSSANLARCTLHKTDLSEADLSYSNMRGTIFEGTDLLGARDWFRARIDSDEGIGSLLSALGFKQ